MASHLFNESSQGNSLYKVAEDDNYYAFLTSIR